MGAVLPGLGFGAGRSVSAPLRPKGQIILRGYTGAEAAPLLHRLTNLKSAE
jgi:hypothetical protein